MRPVPAGVADDIGTAVFNRLSVASDRILSLVIPRTRECILLSTVMNYYSLVDSKVRAVAMANPILDELHASLDPGHQGRRV